LRGRKENLRKKTFLCDFKKISQRKRDEKEDVKSTGKEGKIEILNAGLQDARGRRKLIQNERPRVWGQEGEKGSQNGGNLKRKKSIF